MKLFKNIVFVLLIRILLIQTSSPSEEYIIFWENKETGEVHKCRRENYLEYKELLQGGNFEIDSRLDWSIYYCWEKDYFNIMTDTTKKKIDFGELKQIKSNYEKTLFKKKGTVP